MKHLLLGIAAMGLLTAPAMAGPCKDTKGKFTKCPEKKQVCRKDGRFAKCGTPGAKPA